MSVQQVALWLVPAVLSAAAIVLFIRDQRTWARSQAPSSEYRLVGPGVRDNDRYWLLGGFLYRNPDDPALFVLNRWGIGIAPNLAHPLAVRFAIGLLLVLAMIPIVLILVFPELRTTGCHTLGCTPAP
jgi:uncharacterized membrane protein